MAMQKPKRVLACEDNVSVYSFLIVAFRIRYKYNIWQGKLPIVLKQVQFLKRQKNCSKIAIFQIV